MQGNILITGGAGFLGRAIIRKSIIESWDASFTIVSRDETKQDELMRRYGRQAKIRCYLGDVAFDAQSLARLFAGHDVVIHAAAVKYIPEAEHNRWECERVNVQGSKNVALAAKIADVPTVVGISTDKAVEPINTYGITKAMMENLYAEADRWGGPRFLTVRYGNVVGSTGSVIPLFMRQVRENGQITITDRRMSRFWLPVDAAVRLVETAVDKAEQLHGATLVHACPSMMITKLAEACILAAGKALDEVDIVEIGRRPGEKLEEALLALGEAETRAFYLDTELRGYAVFSQVDPRLKELGAQPETWQRRTEPYTSSDPIEFVDAGEMVEWIADAGAV